MDLLIKLAFLAVLNRHGDLELASRLPDGGWRRLAGAHLLLRSANSTNLHSRARLRLWSFGRLSSTADTNRPVPRLVIDDLDLITRGERGEGAACLRISGIPLAGGEVDEGTFEASHRDDINALNESPPEINERLLDPAPSNVIEDAWNAETDAVVRVGVRGGMIHTRLAVTGSRGIHLGVRHVCFCVSLNEVEELSWGDCLSQLSRFLLQFFEKFGVRERKVPVFRRICTKIYGIYKMEAKRRRIADYLEVVGFDRDEFLQDPIKIRSAKAYLLSI